MAKAPAEMVIANIECPSCHVNVEVRAAMAIKSDEKNVYDLFSSSLKQIGVRIVLQGVFVSHDCRREIPEENNADPG